MSRSAFSMPNQFDLFDELTPLRSEDCVRDLPPQAQELVELIGLSATLELVKAFGGDDPRIPHSTESTSRVFAGLVEAVGSEAAAKLVDRYKDTRLYVPKCQLALLKARDTEIIRRMDSGEPFDAIRRSYRLTRRHLQRIAKKPL